MICQACKHDHGRIHLSVWGLWKCYACLHGVACEGETVESSIFMKNEDFSAIQEAARQSRERRDNPTTQTDDRAGVVRQENPWQYVQRQLAGLVRTPPAAWPTLDRDEDRLRSSQYWSSGRVREVEQVRDGSVVPPGRERLPVTIPTSELVRVQSTDAPETTVEVKCNEQVTIRNDLGRVCRVHLILENTVVPTIDDGRPGEYHDAFERAKSLEL